MEHLDRVSYRTAGRSVKEARVRFDAPAEVLVANVHFRASPGTCSRCLQSTHDDMAAFWQSPYHLLRGTWSVILHRTVIMVGPGYHALPNGHGRVVCYEDCTRELAQEHGLLLIPGRPPSVKEHLRVY